MKLSNSRRIIRPLAGPRPPVPPAAAPPMERRAAAPAEGREGEPATLIATTTSMRVRSLQCHPTMVRSVAGGGGAVGLLCGGRASNDRKIAFSASGVTRSRRDDWSANASWWERCRHVRGAETERRARARPGDCSWWWIASVGAASHARKRTVTRRHSLLMKERRLKIQSHFDKMQISIENILTIVWPKTEHYWLWKLCFYESRLCYNSEVVLAGLQKPWPG